MAAGVKGIIIVVIIINVINITVIINTPRAIYGSLNFLICCYHLFSFRLGRLQGCPIPEEQFLY